MVEYEKVKWRMYRASAISIITQDNQIICVLLFGLMFLFQWCY